MLLGFSVLSKNGKQIATIYKSKGKNTKNDNLNTWKCDINCWGPGGPNNIKSILGKKNNLITVGGTIMAGKRKKVPLDGVPPCTGGPAKDGTPCLAPQPLRPPSLP